MNCMDNLSEDELKRETKPEGRSDNQDSLINELEMFRLKMILRLLKISSFNGKMNAEDEMEWLRAEQRCAGHCAARFAASTAVRR